MLDVPLRRGEDVIGVLCVEHVGEPRTWTVDEQNFAISTANLIAVAIADERRREALSQVAQSDARAHLILDTAHDAFVGMDDDSRIVSWNAQAEQTFGWTREEALGRNLAETIIPPAFREAHMKGMKRFLATGEAPVVNRRLELRGLHRNGHEFPIEITITLPMRRDDGYFFGAFLRDISDRLERDEALRHAKDVAEAATRAKSEFLANMSHELRTPLNGVIGYSQLLQRDRGLTAPQREALDAISKCGAHLLDLINDVLDLSKIEAGRIDIEQTATDLPQLITDLRHVIAETARRKGLVAQHDDRSRSCRSAWCSTAATFGRFCSTCWATPIKFTAKGAGLARHRARRRRADLRGRSTPAPASMPASCREIFDAFTQTEQRRRGGRHRTWPDDQPPPAARSWAPSCRSTAPSARAAASTSRCRWLPPREDDASGDADGVAANRSVARLAPGQQVTALVVDDSTVSRRILASLLESAGLQVITATGGLEGVDARAHSIIPT